MPCKRADECENYYPSHGYCQDEPCNYTCFRSNAASHQTAEVSPSNSSDLLSAYGELTRRSSAFKKISEEHSGKGDETTALMFMTIHSALREVAESFKPKGI